MIGTTPALTTNKALALLSEAGVPHGGDLLRGVRFLLEQRNEARNTAEHLREALMQSLTLQGLATQALKELSSECR